MKKIKIVKNLLVLVIMLTFTFMFDFNIYADGHTHSDSCYNTSSHSHVGDIHNGGDCYQTPVYHQHNENCYRLNCDLATYSSSVESSTLGFATACSNSSCPFNSAGNTIEFDLLPLTKVVNTCNMCGASSTVYHCSGCGTIVSGTNSISHNAISLDYAKNHPSECLMCDQEGQIAEYTLSCSLQEGTTFGELICDKTISYINPKNPIQSGTLDTTVVATYMDEHTSEVKATSNFDSSKTYNGEQITLTYNGFSTNIVFYSSSTTNDIVVNNDAEVSIINDETKINIINDDKMVSTINDETISIVDEVDPENSTALRNPEADLNLKDTIINDLDPEVEYVDGSRNVKSSRIGFSQMIIIVLVIIAIISVCLYIFKDKIIAYFNERKYKNNQGKEK